MILHLRFPPSRPFRHGMPKRGGSTLTMAALGGLSWGNASWSWLLVRPGRSRAPIALPCRHDPWLYEFGHRRRVARLRCSRYLVCRRRNAGACLSRGWRVFPAPGRNGRPVLRVPPSRNGRRVQFQPVQTRPGSIVCPATTNVRIVHRRKDDGMPALAVGSLDGTARGASLRQ